MPPMEKEQKKLRSKVPGYIGSFVIAFWPWLFKAIRWILELVGFGGSIDFLLTRSQNPDWVGDMLEFFLNPPEFAQFISILLAVVVLFRTERRGIRDQLEILNGKSAEHGILIDEIKGNLDNNTKLIVLLSKIAVLLYEDKLVTEGRNNMEDAWNKLVKAVEDNAGAEPLVWKTHYYTTLQDLERTQTVLQMRLGYHLEDSLPESKISANMIFIPEIELVPEQHRQTHRERCASYVSATHRLLNINRSLDDRLHAVCQDIKNLESKS